jgi:integrase
MPLSDVACRTAKPGDRPKKISDGGGLHLLIPPNGSKLWRLNYRFAGKQKTLALGKYPTTTLAEARRQRDAAKASLAAGRDPSVKVDGATGDSFQKVADEWLNAQSNTWTPGYTQRVLSRLKEDIYPDLGSKGVSAIDPPALLRALRKIEDRGAMEIAKRMRQTCGQIFRYAIATGRASRDPSTDLRGALKPSPRVRHMAKLKESELPEFLSKLAAYEGDRKTRFAIELIVHTFVRTNELINAEWREIEGDLWRIPASRMKMGKEHLVPLVPQTKALFDRLRDLDDGPFVCKMSNNTMIYAMYRLGYHSRATIHGFRGTASTALNEAGVWSPDAVEMQLAHSPGGVRAVYNSALYLPERRRMMEWWSDRLSGMS